jgi:predicted unusual protein kinase regulating ubiquinone biosynthesis (AarF/ABC1/UbiB family)
MKNQKGAAANPSTTSSQTRDSREHSQKRVPRGKLARGSIVGATAVKVGAMRVAHLGKRRFVSKQRRKQIDRDIDVESAKVIFEALSTLRGTALKAAQLLAMEFEWVPEPYRRELAKAASQVPAMNRALVLKVLKGELGPLERAFADFSATPFAAASLGQVHAATSHEGTALAVKVQYPGIAQGVEADIAMIKTLLTPTKYAPLAASSFDEIRAKIAEELDYRLEADHTEWFGAHFRDDRFVIPPVWRALGTRVVLVTTRVTGLHLEPWLATRPSQAERDHYGQLLVDFFNQCVFEHGVIHADPNPGNFFFRNDGRLGVVDFGCVKQLAPSYVKNVASFMRYTGESDLEFLVRLFNGIGVFYRKHVDRAALAAVLKKEAEWLATPYRQTTFDFAKSREYVARGTEIGRDVFHFLDRYDGAFVYFDRTIHGLYRTLERLGAHVRMLPDSMIHASNPY